MSLGCRQCVPSRDLWSFEIRFEFESAARFNSIRKWWANSKIFESNRPCLPIARRMGLHLLLVSGPLRCRRRTLPRDDISRPGTDFNTTREASICCNGIHGPSRSLRNVDETICFAFASIASHRLFFALKSRSSDWRPIRFEIPFEFEP